METKDFHELCVFLDSDCKDIEDVLWSAMAGTLMHDDKKAHLTRAVGHLENARIHLGMAVEYDTTGI